MADHVSISVDDRAAQAMFGRFAAVGKKPPMKAVATELYTLVRNTFRRETDPWGGAWPQHSPLTLKARRRKGNASHQKLLDTGRLWASITDSHTDFEAIVTAGEGLGDPRATVNQFGTSNAGRGRNVRIPARPFFPLRGETQDIPAPWWPTLRAPIDKALEEAKA